MLGVGVLGVGVFDAAPSDDEFEFDELAASAFGAAGFVEAWFAGGCSAPTVLSPVPDLALSAGAAGAGDVTGGGVQLGASSGIDGAVAGAGTGSSARREAEEPNNARARPPASAQQRARDARTVDASTGKESIDFGPAFPDALRNTSRLNKFTKQRHEGGKSRFGQGGRSRNAARIGSKGRALGISLRQEGRARIGEGRTNTSRPKICQDRRWCVNLCPASRERSKPCISRLLYLRASRILRSLIGAFLFDGKELKSFGASQLGPPTPQVKDTR